MKLQKFCYGLAWLLLMICASCLISRVYLNSDTLFLESLTQDLFNHHNLWADWRLTAAPAYLPDMLLYFLSSTFLSSVVMRIFFVSFCQVILLTMVGLWLAKKIQPSISLISKIAIILMMIFITLVANHSAMWLYFYTTNNHFAALLFGLLGLGLLLQFTEQPSLLLAITIVLVCAIAKTSTAVFVIGFLIPAILAGLLTFTLSIREPTLKDYSQRIAITTLLLISSFIISHVFDWLLTYHSMLNARLPMSAESAGHAFTLFLQSLRISFAFDNIYTLSLSIIIFLSFIILIVKTLLSISGYSDSSNKLCGLQLPFATQSDNSIDWKLSFCGLLLILIVPINFFGAIISGGFADTAGARYFTVPIGLSLLLTVIVIDKMSHHSDIIRKIYVFIISIIFLILTLLVGQTVKQIFYGSSFSSLIQASYSKDTGETQIANCLETLISQKIPLHAGVADYWFSRGVMIRMRHDTPIEATTNDLTPFFWMSTIGPYIHPERYPKRTYNFIIVHPDNDTDPFNYDTNTLSKIVPRGYTQLTCAHTSVTIWFYPNDQLDKIVKAKQYQLVSTREFRKPQGFCKVINRC